MPCKGVVVVPPATRRRLGGGAPDCTHRIANRAIVCHVLDALAAAGIAELGVVAPRLTAPEIRKCIENDGTRATHISYMEQDEYGGPLGALVVAEEFVGDEPCIVHCADGLTGQELDPFARLLDSGEPDLVLLLHRGAGHHDPLESATQRLLGIAELTGSKTGLGLVGICLFGPGVLRESCARAWDRDPELDLTVIAARLASEGHSLEARFVRNWRRYRGDPLDLLELNRVALDQQIPAAVSVDGGDNRIEGRVMIHHTADVRSSIILGPSIIGPATRISHSYIGPYTSIGAGAEIEGAQIERSIISDMARITHVSDRIEASTVGRRTSIFRDFALPRAMRLHVGEGVEIALC